MAWKDFFLLILGFQSVVVLIQISICVWISVGENVEMIHFNEPTVQGVNQNVYFLPSKLQTVT